MSLVTRLVAVVCVVAALAVAITGLVVRELSAQSTIDEVEGLLENQQFVATELELAALAKGSWTVIDDEVEDLAEATGLRVVVTNLDGGVLVDSEGDVPLEDRTALSSEPVQLLDVVDAFETSFEAAFDEVDEQAFFDEYVKCLEAQGAFAGFEVDAFGQQFPVAADFAAEEFCLEQTTFVMVGGPEFQVLDAVVLEPTLLYLGYSGTSALDTIDDGIGSGVIVTMLVVTAVAGAVMWWWGSRTLRPVGTIAAAARRMGDGDLGVRVDTEAPAELGDLAGAFNEMASGLAGEDERRRRLTSDIAHELRNPLANVSGYLDAVADGVMAADDELLGILRDETDHLGHLVEDLQTLTLADAGDLYFSEESVDVAELLRSVQSVHSGRAEQAGVELSVVGATEAVVTADLARLRQVVGNLVENAIRYSDAGTTVELAGLVDGTEAVIEVRDEGIGIDPEQQRRIFERFHRVDASRTRATGGVGLGLSIAQRFAEAMGGSITVVSELGRGSTFSVRLPLQQADRADQ